MRLLWKSKIECCLKCVRRANFIHMCLKNEYFHISRKTKNRCIKGTGLKINRPVENRSDVLDE